VGSRPACGAVSCLVVVLGAHGYDSTGVGWVAVGWLNRAEEPGHVWGAIWTSPDGRRWSVEAIAPIFEETWLDGVFAADERLVVMGEVDVDLYTVARGTWTRARAGETPIATPPPTTVAGGDGGNEAPVVAATIAILLLAVLIFGARIGVRDPGDRATVSPPPWPRCAAPDAPRPVRLAGGQSVLLDGRRTSHPNPIGPEAAHFRAFWPAAGSAGEAVADAIRPVRRNDPGRRSSRRCRPVERVFLDHPKKPFSGVASGAWRDLDRDKMPAVIRSAGARIGHCGSPKWGPGIGPFTADN